MTCAHCEQPNSDDRPLVMHEKQSGNDYHARCWYEMRTGRPIDFPEHQLTWRTIELVRLLEVMEGHGEAASSSSIIKQWSTNDVDLVLIQDPDSPLPYRVVRWWHETPDTLDVVLLTADLVEAERVYYLSMFEI
jgi:hypothetical protein